MNESNNNLNIGKTTLKMNNKRTIGMLIPAANNYYDQNQLSMYNGKQNYNNTI
jgi:hypothetical protein